MALLHDLPVEVLQAIPIGGRDVRALALTSGTMYEVFIPLLYHTVQFQALESAEEQKVRACCSPKATCSPPEGSRLTSPRAIHLWLHTLGANPRLRSLTRRLSLLKDLSLKDNPPNLDEALSWEPVDPPPERPPRRKCDIPLCARYDWTFLGSLPCLEHVAFSDYWQQFFVLRPSPLPRLQSVCSVAARGCQELSGAHPDHIPTGWDILDLRRLTTQPAMRAIRLLHGQICWPGPLPDKLMGVTSPVECMLLDLVEVQRPALRVLLADCPVLRCFRWRRLLDACRPWHECRCDDAVTGELGAALVSVRHSLVTLHLDLCSHEGETWGSQRCLRNCSLLPTLGFLTRLVTLEIAVELLLGRRVCRRYHLTERVGQHPPEALAGKLPAGLRQLTLFVHVFYAMYEAGFRRRLLDGILQDRSRLSSLRHVILDDRVGDVFDEDVCGRCAVHDPFCEPIDLRRTRERCAQAGLALTYHASLAV